MDAVFALHDAVCGTISHPLSYGSESRSISDYAYFDGDPGRRRIRHFDHRAQRL